MHNFCPPFIHHSYNRSIWVLAITVFLFGCTSSTLPLPSSEAPIQVSQTPFTQASQCSGKFIAHELPHITAQVVERVPYFISNGSGLAVNDLDNDDDLDLVLGNILGPNQIFWNEGDLNFRPETLFEGSTRAITIVDIEGDGWLDIVLTTRTSNVRLWRNTGTDQTSSVSRFVEATIPGVRSFAYSINWADWDGDNDLDLVTASYDAALEKQLGDNYQQSNLNGVFVYEHQADRFEETARLQSRAQALAIEIVDLDQDSRPDILVGNDFDVPDYVWHRTDIGWQSATPFAEMTMSTMSFASDDLNNDGQAELFAADMHPYSDAPDMMAQWQPVIDTMVHDLPPDDPQAMANVLQTKDAQNRFSNVAEQSGIAATGWSWSAKFGDLDQDGYLDLYVVNGMTAMEIFSHLPNDELVEENQVYKNNGQGRFTAMPEWGLNSTYGGRSMSMADLDEDGDLDIIVNNLRQPAQIFENQLCQGASLAVDLRWPSTNNTRAIGAKLTLKTSEGTYTRQVRAASGYLSGSPSQIHFGIPSNSVIQHMDIVWPDGRLSRVTQLEPNHHIQIVRE
ncbi:MAG: CRTAC1 family protein [Chloroflexota bacterium]